MPRKKGFKHSKETIKKMSNSHKGKKGWNKGLTKDTDFRVKKQSISQKGVKRSEEAKKNMSKAQKGVKRSEIAKKNMSIAQQNRNFKHSLKSKKKMSKAHLGHLTSIKTREKISKANKGKKRTKETKEKISKKLKGKKLSKAHKQNISKNHAMHNKANRVKLSETRKRKILTGEINLNSKTHQKIKYNGALLWNKWELKTAKWLNKNKIKWIYNKKINRIKLDNGSSYNIDFYLPELNKYIEVKGWWDDNSKYKYKQAKKQKLNMCIIDKRNINDINLNITKVLA